MRRHCFFTITLVLLVLVLPLSALAHLTFFEGEVFRRYLGPTLVISFGDFMEIDIVNNEQPDWGKETGRVERYVRCPPGTRWGRLVI